MDAWEEYAPLKWRREYGGGTQGLIAGDSGRNCYELGVYHDGKLTSEPRARRLQDAKRLVDEAVSRLRSGSPDARCETCRS